MALTRGQAIEVLRWVGQRRTLFSWQDVARGCELDKRTAQRWISDLLDRGIVERARRGRWVSRLRFEVIP